MTADSLAFPPDCGVLLSHILSPSPSPGPPYVHTFNYPRTEDDDLAIRAGLISLRQARDEFGFDPAGEPEDERDLAEWNANHDEDEPPRYDGLVGLVREWTQVRNERVRDRLATPEPEDERDLIDRIDDLTAEVGKCWQCHRSIPVGCPSDDFCGPVCQENWHAARCEPIASYIEAGHDFYEDEVRFNRIDAGDGAPTFRLRREAAPPVRELTTTTVEFDSIQLDTANLFSRDYYFNGCPEGSEDPQEAWTLAQLHQAALIENAARDVCRAFGTPPELVQVGIPEVESDSRDDRMRRALEAHQNRGTGPQRSQRAPRRIDPARKWRG